MSQGARLHEPQPVHDGRPWLAGSLAAFAVALVVLLATGHTRVEVSADEYGPTPLWTILLPVAVGLALVRLVPPRPPAGLTRRVHASLRGRSLGLEVLLLLTCLVVFVGALWLIGDTGGTEGPAALLYPLGKVVLLLAGPALVLRFLRPGWRSEAPRLSMIATRPWEAWRWGGAVAVAGYLYLTTFSPLAPPAPSPGDLPPAGMLVTVVLVVFLTASVLEEIFFRAWLQTRLEILFGRWPGILLGSLAFAFMHIVSHRAAGNVGVDLATAVVVQGTMGVLFGYLWARYRNVWLNIALHAGANALSLVPVLLAG